MKKIISEASKSVFHILVRNGRERLPESPKATWHEPPGASALSASPESGLVRLHVHASTIPLFIRSTCPVGMPIPRFLLTKMKKAKNRQRCLLMITMPEYPECVVHRTTYPVRPNQFLISNSQQILTQERKAPTGSCREHDVRLDQCMATSQKTPEKELERPVAWLNEKAKWAKGCNEDQEIGFLYKRDWR